jgi:LysM repeat protein
MAGLIVVVALALFFLPAFLGIGGGGGSASPSPSASSAISTAEPSPTAPPAPTQQVYVVKAGDTMSKIARNFGLTADQLCTANKATVKDCNKIAIGAELIIPTPPPDEFTDTPAPSSS